MNRRWGQGALAGEEERRTDGRFRSSVACDACGRGVGRLHDVDAVWYTDNDVCGSGDGPGFFLCDRASCRKRYEAMDVEERRALYTAQRAKNRAVSERRKKPAKPVVRSYTAECLRVLDAVGMGVHAASVDIERLAGCEAAPVIAVLMHFSRFEPVGPDRWRRIA